MIYNRMNLILKLVTGVEFRLNVRAPQIRLRGAENISPAGFKNYGNLSLPL